MKDKGFTISELLVVFTVVIITSGFMFPAIQYTRVRMRKIMCANNLREIGMALYIYAKENGGKFPQTLKTLYDEHYLADKKIMDCAGTKEIGTPLLPDYEYTEGMTIKDSSREVLVKDKPQNHAHKGVNVLYLNGKIEWEAF